jgi:hypothetical protein
MAEPSLINSVQHAKGCRGWAAQKDITGLTLGLTFCTQGPGYTGTSSSQSHESSHVRKYLHHLPCASKQCRDQ